MHHAETDEPEQQRVRHGEAIDDAENQLRITEVAKDRVGVMAAVDQCEAVEEQHDGGGEPVVSLHHQGHAEQTARRQRDEEVEDHLDHPLVEDETKVVPFRLHDGENEDCEQRHREQTDGDQRGDTDARRGVEHGESLQVFATRKPIPHPNDRCRHRGRDRRIQSDYNDGPSANRLKA